MLCNLGTESFTNLVLNALQTGAARRPPRKPVVPRPPLPRACASRGSSSRGATSSRWHVEGALISLSLTPPPSLSLSLSLFLSLARSLPLCLSLSLSLPLRLSLSPSLPASATTRAPELLASRCAASSSKCVQKNPDFQAPHRIWGFGDLRYTTRLGSKTRDCRPRTELRACVFLNSYIGVD